MASFILPIISGLAGLFGGAPKTTTQTLNSDAQGQSNTQGSQSGQSNTQSSQSPVLSQLQQLIQSITAGSSLKALQGPNPYSQGGAYDAEGLQAINSGASNAKKISDSILASRGLSYSPYAAYASMIPETNRIQQGVQFQEQLPQLQDQYRTQQIQTALQAGGFGGFGSQSSGQTTAFGNTSGSTQSSESGSSTGTSTSPNQMLPGLFAGLGAGLASPSGGAGSDSNLQSIFKALGLG